MLTTLLIALLGLALFAYVALPLLDPKGADPLPTENDPVLTDLEEEKEALFRAIRELDSRDDLAPERREQLRARYEAKAARVLRALDERSSEQGGRQGPRPRRRTRIPYGALALLAGAVVIATSLGSFVLPRVGENASLTSFFREDLDTARALRDLQRAAERNPDAENLLALADAYWRLDEADKAREIYQRIVEESGAESAVAYRRLAFLSLQTDVDQALEYLERSRRLDPSNLDTLYILGEIRFARGELEAAREAWQTYLEASDGQEDAEVRARLQLTEEIEPLLERVEADPSKENLLDLANALWQHDERQRAVEAYFRVLTQHDPNDPVALGRTGQLLFISGRNEDALALMERAAMSERVDAQTLLFLGNAYFSAERYGDAIEAWERHVAMVGEEQAGRVPGLIADARSRLEQADGNGTEAGAEAPADGGATASTELDGQALFAANCSSCHGIDGAGGSGPRLAGNPRAADADNARQAVRFGRGMMPGFAAVLSDEQIEAIVMYVTGRLNSADAAR